MQDREPLVQFQEKNTATYLKVIIFKNHKNHIYIKKKKKEGGREKTVDHVTKNHNFQRQVFKEFSVRAIFSYFFIFSLP